MRLICLEGEDTEILDCRNYYESEVGLFDGAHRLPIAKHLDSFDEIDKHLEQFDKDKKILIVRLLFIQLLVSVLPSNSR